MQATASVGTSLEGCSLDGGASDIFVIAVVDSQTAKTREKNKRSRQFGLTEEKNQGEENINVAYKNIRVPTLSVA